MTGSENETGEREKRFGERSERKAYTHRALIVLLLVDQIRDLRALSF